MEIEPDEREEADGAIYTHVTCPACSTVFEIEGDAQADAVECPDCGAELVVRIT